MAAVGQAPSFDLADSLASDIMVVEPSATTGMPPTAESLARRIGEAAPEWAKAAQRCIEVVGPTTGVVVQVASRLGTDQADVLMRITVQAGNDFVDLIADAWAGRGRPALRTARGLFDQEIAAREIAADGLLAKRWLDYANQTLLAESGLMLPGHHLQGNALKQWRHRQKVQRRNAGDASAKAKAHWGTGFARSWNPRSTYDLATLYGRAEHYDFYRYASAPTHGSAEMTGLVKNIDGMPVMRTGPALAASPLALLYGTDSFLALLDATDPVIGHDALRTLRSNVEMMNSRWSELHRAVVGVDEEVWPTQRPQNFAALFVLQPDGTGDWYEYVPSVRQARRATGHGVTIHHAQQPMLDNLLNYFAGLAHGRVGIALVGAEVQEPGPRHWVRAESLLDSPPLTISVEGTLNRPSDFAPPIAWDRFADAARQLRPK